MSDVCDPLPCADPRACYASGVSSHLASCLGLPHPQSMLTVCALCVPCPPRPFPPPMFIFPSVKSHSSIHSTTSNLQQ
eukprot:scaffold35779_cov36-Tisochrysis_lutea.AAC.1